MKINFNGKQSLVIGGAAALTGAVIFGVTKLVGVIGKKTKKNPEAEEAEEQTEPEETEDSE